MGISVMCDCGTTIDTKINSCYDIMIRGEDGYYKEIECVDCGSKYRVRFMVDILSPPTKTKIDEDD